MGRRSAKRQSKRAGNHSPNVTDARSRWSGTLAAALGVLAVGAMVWSQYRGTSPARDGSPAWSPDGTRIAFYSERDGNAEIYVMRADGGGQTRLTSTPSDEGYPSWSPDGQTITFDSDRDGNFEIYAMNADGTNVRRLTNAAARDVSASWSPDGARLAFMSDRAGGFDVYVMRADGSDVVRRSTTGTSWFPTWSPDGTRLAFHVGRDVHVIEANGVTLQRLTTDPANGMYPSWSPDGTRLVFMSWRNGRSELFVMNADGSDQRRLLSMDQGDAIDPRWSPDGSRIAFVHVPSGMNGAERAICVVNADGTGVRRLSR